MRGKCPCGEVGFEPNGEVPDLYRFHCRFCRRLTKSPSPKISTGYFGAGKQ